MASLLFSSLFFWEKADIPFYFFLLFFRLFEKSKAIIEWLHVWLHRVRLSRNTSLKIKAYNRGLKIAVKLNWKHKQD